MHLVIYVVRNITFLLQTHQVVPQKPSAKTSLHSKSLLSLQRRDLWSILYTRGSSTWHRCSSQACSRRPPLVKLLRDGRSFPCLLCLFLPLYLGPELQEMRRRYRPMLLRTLFAIHLVSLLRRSFFRASCSLRPCHLPPPIVRSSEVGLDCANV
jgi:hypothetical protein